MYGRVARICTSFIDAPGKIAVSIYFSGCTLRCKDCQNKELWEAKSGKQETIESVVQQIEEHPLANAVVFVGGEPTDQMKFLQELCAKIKKKERVLYTGREFEDLPQTLLQHLDMIICGPYKSEFHVGGWPASSNQRVFTKKGNTWKHKTT